MPAPVDDATAGAPGSRPLRVVYVVGKGRSGSTLLDDLLGTIPGVVSLGELRLLWERAFVQGYRCACGDAVADCPLWAPATEAAIGPVTAERLAEIDALQRRVMRWPHVPRALLRASSADRAYGSVMGRLYAAVADRVDATARTGEPPATVLVDSSKWPLHPGLLGAVPGVEPWVLHLVRDPRAVAHSYRRRKGGEGQPELPRFGGAHTAASWTARNALVELAARSVPASRRLRLRYEDLVAHPRDTIVALGQWLGIDEADGAFVSDTAVALGTAHLVGGNPRRFDRGTVDVTADEEWTVTSPARRLLVGALTAPLRGRYGYGRSDR